LRIVLDDNEQSRQSSALLIRCLNRLLRRLRAGKPCARIRNLAEDVLFLLRDSFRRFDEIGNQVIPTLELVLDLSPLCLDGFFLADEPVVRTPRGHHRCREQQRNRYG
jgi:hypothetical protein